ncbi:MAG: DUF971 domain-containing protein [Candidatus Kapaibacterium sp.]
MGYPAPKTITKSPDGALRLIWGDGTTSDLPLQFLRKECPCAHCKGETILGKHYAPLTLPTFVEGMNELAGVEPVGSYAIQISWKDGHKTGIYTWEYLLLLSRKTEEGGEEGMKNSK